jgi:hypothetical protein
LTATESDERGSRYSAYHASWKWFVLSVAVRFGTILSVLLSFELLRSVSDDQSQVSSYSVLLECDLRTGLTGSKAAEFHGAVTLVFLGLPSILACLLSCVDPKSSGDFLDVLEREIVEVGWN